MDQPSIRFYGVERVFSDSGIDLTLIRQRLRLTVTERWERNARALELVEVFRKARRVTRGRSPSPPGVS